MTGATLVGIHRVPQRDDDQEGLDRWPTLCSVDATPEEQKLRSVSGRRKRLAAQIKDVRAEEREAILAAHHWLHPGLRSAHHRSEAGPRCRRLGYRYPVRREHDDHLQRAP
jgi:hypothetical protein